MNKEEDPEKKALEDQDFLWKSISRFIELCPEGKFLLLGGCEAHIQEQIQKSNRNFDSALLVDSSGITKAEKPAYETYAGVLLSTAQNKIRPEEWPLVLNTAWNSLKTKGVLSLILEESQQLALEKVTRQVRHAGFYVLETVSEDGAYCLIAVKPRLGTNVLDYSVDERAAGQTP